MDLSNPFDASAGDTHAQLMQATYDALQKYGYGDLTIQRIGDEFPKSKSLVYQHYDGKDELLVDFLAFILEHFESEFKDERSLAPAERLQRILDHTLSSTISEDHHAFLQVMTVLRGQAPYDEAFVRYFSETDREFKSVIEATIREGIDTETFRDVDSKRVAEYITSTILGTITRRATTDEEVNATSVRQELDEYLRLRLGLEREE